MEQTLPPLVSDEYLSSLTPISQDWKDGPCTPVTPTEVRNIYEAERSKLMEKITRLEGTTNFEVVPKEQYDRALEVVQSLVDALKLATGWLPYHEHMEEDSENKFDATDKAIVYVLALAKSINIEPTKP